MPIGYPSRQLRQYGSAAPLLFDFLGFAPQGVELIQGAILDGPPGFAQCLLDKSEAPLELAVGGT